MMANPTVSNSALIMWNGTTSFPRQLVGWNHFGVVIEVVNGPLAAAVTFDLVTYDASALDPCVPDLTTAQPFDTIPNCVGGVGAPAQIIIPAGTPTGNLCTGALPCIPGKFVGIVPAAVPGPVADVQIAGLFMGKHLNS